MGYLYHTCTNAARAASVTIKIFVYWVIVCRGRYQSLSLLLPKVGGHRFLHVNPNVNFPLFFLIALYLYKQIIQTLILSVRIRDIASSASTLFGNFLKSFKDLMPMTSIRELWMTDIARCLCSSEHKLRYCAYISYIDVDYTM